MVRTVRTLLTARATIIAVEPFATSAALNTEISRPRMHPSAQSPEPRCGWPLESDGPADSTPKQSWVRVRALLESAAADCDVSPRRAETAVALVKLGYTASDANVQAEIVTTVVTVIRLSFSYGIKPRRPSQTPHLKLSPLET